MPGRVDDLAERVRRARAEHLAALSCTQAHYTQETVCRGRTISASHRALPQRGWVSTLDDITERRLIERRMAHLAHHDTLTDLPNRSAFGECLVAALTGETVSCALLYLDLDRFKPVNDTLGHAVGDLVLREVSERIKSQLRKHDVAARLGGDEFAVLISGNDTPSDVLLLAKRLISEISRPVVAQGMQVSVGASVGIALAPHHGGTPEILLRNADLALYRAKESGRGRPSLYEPGMELIVQQRRDLERDLRAALADGEFALHYQPVVNAERDTIAGFEALLRWQSPTRGAVAPNEFIPFAEEIGLMRDIGEWVLRTACREASTWPGDLQVAVNLSPTQFRLPDLVERIAAVLEETGLAAGRLELEITETAMIDDIASAAETLHRLRALGVFIAMDDFGTGYSSLSFLRTLPFTRIKIDRSFVQDLGKKPEAAAIVRAVSGLCTSLGVSATAEGVESEHQMAMLRAEGCSQVQGFLISRPRPAASIGQWIAGFHAASGGR